MVIPVAWIEAKRKQISAICQENVLRKKDNKELFTYNGIDVGTKFSESSLIKYMNLELRRLSNTSPEKTIKARPTHYLFPHRSE